MTISPSSSGGRRAVRRREPGFVAQDLRLESLELGAGLDSELVDEAGARVLVHLQRFGLPARAIQREHQLPAERLAKRMLAYERLELTDDVAVPAELEVGVDPLLEGDEPQLLEPPDLRLCEVVERELRERWTRARDRARPAGGRGAPLRAGPSAFASSRSKRRASI